MNRLTKYCDSCETVVELDESGYCLRCGKHADNMLVDGFENYDLTELKKLTK